jgi:hypothetical protein
MKELLYHVDIDIEFDIAYDIRGDIKENVSTTTFQTLDATHGNGAKRLPTLPSTETAQRKTHVRLRTYERN